MNLTEAHKAAAFEWLRYLAERHGNIDGLDRKQAEIALRAWHDESDRAQRAEAECERLRKRERQLYDALWTLNGHAMLYMGSLADNVSREVGEALTTPTPENGACKRCNGRGTTPFDSNVSGPFPCNRCGGNGKEPDDAHPTPEQTGDALAALDKVRREVSDSLHHSDDSIGDCDLTVGDVRQALTASGVPEGWKWQTERDVTDEYVTSLIAPDGTTVYVGEDDKAIAWLECLLSANSGVPYPVHVAFEPLPINVVFDGPPGPTSGRFVEVETDDGESIRVGEWIEREDGLWSLRIDCSGVPYVPKSVGRLPDKLSQFADSQDEKDSWDEGFHGGVMHAVGEMEATLAAAQPVNYIAFLEQLYGSLERAIPPADESAELVVRAAYESIGEWLNPTDQKDGALASAPAVDEETLIDRVATCMNDNVTTGYSDARIMAKRLLDAGWIAAAPQRGGE